MFNIALVAFFITLAIAVFFYFRPHFISEGFTTIAIDDVTAPKCFLRDAEAQQLVTEFASIKKLPPASEPAMALAEFTLILQKLLCIDADLAGSGMGPYSTFQLAYATAHDIEPAASFVGRCMRNAVRSRDIEMAMGKFEDRGMELLPQMCGGDAARCEAAKTKFHNIVMRATRNISEYCLKEKASLDRPAGARDPAFYNPGGLADSSREYTISGGGVQYI